MTPRQPHIPLRRALARSHRSFLNAWAARFVLRSAGMVAPVIAGAMGVGTFFPAGETVSWVRLWVVLALGAVAIGIAVTSYRRAAERFDPYLERIERSFPKIRSWLRNALDFEARPPRDTSAELAAAVSTETARRLADVPLESLSPRLEARRPGVALLASLAVIVALGVALPQRATRSWATLWNPALAAPPIRLAVEPGSVTITPGAALSVRARVWGSTRVPRILREGERAVAATSEGRTADGARTWRFDLSQLTRAQDYRVRVASVESPKYRIALAGEPTPVSFEVEYRSPAYARLPVQRGSATRGDLSALRGSRARLEVTFDRDLTSLSSRLPGGATRRWTAISARRWRGEVPVEREGDYELLAGAASGEASYRYRITPLADAPPVIAVRIPAGDLDLPAGQKIPVDVIGQDDLGLSELKLQFRKDPAAPWTELPLARFPGQPREASVQSRWDASSLALLPGETATFRFEISDNNAVSGRGRAVSPTFELRFPGLSELYDRVDQTQGGVQNTLEKAAEQVRELQKSLDKLARQPASHQPQSQPAFERSEEMKSALERQQEIATKVDEAARQLQESLTSAAERRAFNEELTRKLQQMAQLMEQIQSREFREALKRMQEALEKLDRTALERNLPQWRQENQEMLANLERTIELLKQLRQEERLESLSQRAQELKDRQDALNREHQAGENAKQNESKESRESKESKRAQAEADAKALAQQQERAAQESEELAKDARELAAETEGSEEKQPMDQAASELDPQASESQHEASKSAADRQSQRGRQLGEKASESLKRAAEQLSSAVKSMQQRRSGADLAAVRRAGQDLVSLQRESEANLESTAPLNQRADQQTDLSEGVSRVADSLATLAKKSPFISPRLGEALGQAINGLSSSGRELSSGNRVRGEQSGRGGSSALNEAVLELRRIESSMCQSGSQGGATPKPGSAAQRIGELGERQSQLNQQTRSVARRLSEQLRLSAGDREQLQRYAEEQRRLREQLEQIQKDDETRRELLGRLDAAQREMKEVEEIMQNGATDGELEQKQQRILSRLLDAQRSVNRRDFDPTRESRPGEDVARVSAPELPADLLRENDRLRLNLLRAEADRYPAQYRAFIESYLRRLNGSTR